MNRIILFVIAFLASIGTFARYSISEYSIRTGYPLWHITSMLQDADSIIWISTWNGLYRFDGYEMVNFKANVGDSCEMISDRFRNIMLSDDGDIYCLVDAQTYIFRRSNYKYERLNDNQSDSIMRLMRARRSTTFAINEPIEVEGQQLRVDHGMKDLQGNMWYFDENTLYKVVKDRRVGQCIWRDFGALSAAYVDSKGNRWFGFDNGPLICDKGDHETHILDADGNFVNDGNGITSVHAILETANGILWFATNGNGIYRYKNGQIEHYDMSNSAISSDNIYDLARDGQGRLWIATYGGGLSCIEKPNAEEIEVASDANQKLHYPLFLPAKLRQIISIDKVLMVASDNGLLRVDLGKTLDDASYTVYKREVDNQFSISKDLITGLTMLSPDTLCLAVEGGGINLLNINDPHARFRHLDHDMTTIDIALGVFEDNKHLWAICPDKLVRISRDGAEQFSAARDLGASFFNESKPVRGNDGTWYLGTRDGVFVTKPINLQMSDFVPHIILSKMRIHSKPLEYAVDRIDTIYLNSEERNITFYFAALDYKSNENIRYSYRFDEGDWLLAVGRTLAFAGLDAGTKTVEVRTTNADGVWTNNCKKILLIMEPKFYETNLFMLLMVILVVGVIVATFMAYRHLSQRLNLRRHALEAYIELTENAEQQQNKFNRMERERQLTLEKYATDEQLKSLTEFIKENIGNSMTTLEDMAEHVNLSPSALALRTKEVLGVMPYELLRRARIHLSCDMLFDESLRISDIATMCGYSDPKLYAADFKRITGFSPAEYRDRLKC